MTLVKVSCTDQTLEISTQPVIASGGINEDEITFEFCELWTGYIKTAVFYRSPREVYHVLLVDDACTIPQEVLTDPGPLFFGVFGVKGDTTRTTVIVQYDIEQGAITSGTQVPAPTPSIYEQLLQRLSDIEAAAVNPEVIAAAVEDYLEDNPPAPSEDAVGILSITIMEV